MALTSGEYIDIAEFLKDAGFEVKPLKYMVKEDKSFVFKMLVFLGLTQK